MSQLQQQEASRTPLQRPDGKSTQAAPNVLLPRTCHVCACRARRGNSRRLAKSRPYTGPSAGAEVARLRKWHVWCFLEVPIIEGQPPFAAHSEGRGQKTSTEARLTYTHTYIYIYVYIYRERDIERKIHIYIHMYTYAYT